MAGNRKTRKWEGCQSSSRTRLTSGTRPPAPARAGAWVRRAGRLGVALSAQHRQILACRMCPVSGDGSPGQTPCRHHTAHGLEAPRRRERGLGMPVAGSADQFRTRCPAVLPRQHAGAARTAQRSLPYWRAGRRERQCPRHAPPAGHDQAPAWPGMAWRKMTLHDHIRQRQVTMTIRGFRLGGVQAD